MSNNPFADAIKPRDDKPTTHTRVDYPDFFGHKRAEGLREQVRHMTRQDMFVNGMLTPADMDDEELRAGRMRDPNGKIDRRHKASKQPIPHDLYDAMVLEHQSRTQERYRQAMDDALNTILEIMLDPANEPRDRLDAAKHVKEQVMGKTPDRVQMTVSKAPWEEMFIDFANTTRERHAKLQEGYIDAEVVEGDEQTTASKYAEAQRDSEYGETYYDADTYSPEQQQESTADPRIKHPTPAPTHDKPASNNPVQDVSNSELFRWERCDQLWHAERRKAFQDRIKAAKASRAAKRATGSTRSNVNVSTEFVESEDDPDTGKMRHTTERKL